MSSLPEKKNNNKNQKKKSKKKKKKKKPWILAKRHYTSVKNMSWVLAKERQSRWKGNSQEFHILPQTSNGKGAQTMRTTSSIKQHKRKLPRGQLFPSRWPPGNHKQSEQKLKTNRKWKNMNRNRSTAVELSVINYLLGWGRGLNRVYARAQPLP